ncbi:MAG: hypothetical protein K6F17_06755 [Lachnospiraceae bacterium]|nr:hypothetical protein [Lachnospiraceae bacterium]
MGFLFGRTKHNATHEPETVDDLLADETKVEEPRPENLSTEDKREYGQSIDEAFEELNTQGERLRREYAMTSAYLSDIQLIDNMPEELRAKVTHHAKNILSLMVDRKMFQSGKPGLSDRRYTMFESLSDTAVDDIKQMQNDEKRVSMIVKDIKILDGEKASLRRDIRFLQNERKNAGNFMIVFFGVMLFIFLMYIVTGLVNKDPSHATVIDNLFLSLLLGCLILVVMTFCIIQRKIKEIKLSKSKLDRAIFLHNKVKIKYVNAVTLLDYRKAKYDVDSSYTLGKYYEAYLEEKKTRERYFATAGELNTSMNRIMDILKKQDLYDPNIWQAQIRALADPKEMVEVRHRLNERRGKLRIEIAENEKRIEELNFEKQIYSITNDR